MKNVWRNLFFLLLALNVAVILIFVTSFNRENARRLMSYDLSNAIRAHEDGTTPYVDIATVVPFSWDRLYVFGPYTPCGRVDGVLGTPLFWLQCKRTNIESREDISLLVFMRGRWPVQYIAYDRDEGDFSEAFRSAGYGYEEARFMIDEQRRIAPVLAR